MLTVQVNIEKKYFLLINMAGAKVNYIRNNRWLITTPLTHCFTMTA